MMWAIGPLIVIAVLFLVFQMVHSSTAPDTSATAAEYNNASIIAIDPTSELAKSVTSHLNAPAPTPPAT